LEQFVILHLFVPLFWSTACMLVVAPLAIRLAQRLNLMDIPYSAPHKTHDHPVPKAGGMALALVLALVTAVSGRLVDADVRGILASAVVILIFGLLDDAFRLSAAWKFLGQVIAVMILVSQGVWIQIFRQPLIDVPLTFLWVIGITNAFNFVDSMDGLAIGLAGIASAFFMLVALDSGQEPLAYLGAILVGSCVGLAWFNIMPARSFLGDSGAQLLGFLLAAIGIAYNPPNLPQPSSWFVPILLLAVPIFDMVLVVFSRLRRGTAPYQAGHDHTYHRLVRHGLPPMHAISAMHLSAILAGCLAFMALPLQPLWANVIFAAVLLAGLVFLIWIRRGTE
jgi:UDP-GlcNAc:undecaprenyl-phosphate GlcNAc-1-phosphate transferase